MKQEDFNRWFTQSFWKAFKDKALPILVPENQVQKTEVLNRAFQMIISGSYAPSAPEREIVINKGFGVVRTVPIFCVTDYCVYYFCIKELEEILCGNRTLNTFGGWTLGGKIRDQEKHEVESELVDYGRYSFNPYAWTHFFGEFNSLLFAQLNEHSFPHILALDISNFYDCIRLDILERWIREDASPQKGAIIALLFYFLNHWNRKNTGLYAQVVGIPQDALADCSRILANYYLQRYDKFAADVCSKFDAMYFRYADDQMILLRDKNQVEAILLALSQRLNKYGLRINQKKVNLWTADGLKRHRHWEIQSLFAIDRAKQNPVTVTAFVNAYLKLKSEDLNKSWNRGLPLLNRLLGAKLELLSHDLLEKLMHRFMTDNFLLQAKHRQLLHIDNLNKKLSRPHSFRVKLELLVKRSVHNSFHFEVKKFAQLIKNGYLESVVVSRLQELDEIILKYDAM